MGTNTRATFIVAEPLPFEGLSSRKLVLETAYFNVLTAYEADEAESLLRRFPDVDAVILHSELYRNRLPERIGVLKDVSGVPVIVLAAGENVDARGADHMVSSHVPQELLELLTERFCDQRMRTPSAKSA